MAEATTAFVPNEIDIICEFNHQVYQESKTSVKLLDNGAYIMKDTDIYKSQFIDPRDLADKFYRAVSSCIRQLIAQSTAEKFPGLVLHKRALQLRDKISCLHLMWTGEVFGNTKIYVDLIPAYALPESFEPVVDLPLRLGSQICHIVAKKSRHNTKQQEQDCLFSYSFALHENACLLGLPSNVRLGYTLAKALRIAAISKPSSFDGLNLERNERYNTEDIVTSYMLKTCLLLIYREYKDHGVLHENVRFLVYKRDNNFCASESKKDLYNSSNSRKKRNNPDVAGNCVIQGSVHMWAHRVYSKLYNAVHDRNLPTYYGDGILFQCEKLTADGSTSCCLKRQLILRVCDAILNWLEKNQIWLDRRFKKAAKHTLTSSSRRRSDNIHKPKAFVHKVENFHYESCV